jgi:hypothetical protein
MTNDNITAVMDDQRMILDRWHIKKASRRPEALEYHFWFSVHYKIVCVKIKLFHGSNGKTDTDLKKKFIQLTMETLQQPSFFYLTWAYVITLGWKKKINL